MVTRAMLLAVLAVSGCGGGDNGGDVSIALYHLQAQIEGPVADGDVVCPADAPVCPFTIELDEPVEYRVSGEPALDANDFVLEETTVTQDPAFGRPLVTLVLTDGGREKFAELTERIARAGREAGAWHSVAVVVDGELVAHPGVSYEEYPDGIRDAPAIQLGADTREAADEIAQRIRGD